MQLKRWRPGKGGNRSLKLLVIAAVTYAISIQFKWAFPTFQSPQSRYDKAAFEPPGARRWESDEQQSNTLIGGEGRPFFYKAIPSKHSASQDIDAPHDEDRTLVNHLRGDKLQDEENSSPSRRVPRVVATEVGCDVNCEIMVVPLTANKFPDFEEESIPENAPIPNKDWYEPNADWYIDGYDWDVCEPMYDWQMQSFPNCNNFHELDMEKLSYLAKGGSRVAFELKQNLDGKEEKFVYKAPKYWKEYSGKLVEEQRKDALILERTTKSKFLPDIHGYCSLGVMMDFMPEGNMHMYIKGARLAGGSTLPPVDRLRLAIHVATSVADLHTIDDTPMPSFFHNDSEYFLLIIIRTFFYASICTHSSSNFLPLQFAAINIYSKMESSSSMISTTQSQYTLIKRQMNNADATVSE